MTPSEKLNENRSTDESDAKHKYEHFRRLKRLKRLALCLCAFIYVISNRTETLETLQFLWSCYVSEKHNLPITANYNHTAFALTELGANIADFLKIMLIGYAAYFAFRLFCPAEDLTEIELENRHREAKRSYAQLVRESRQFVTSEEILEQNIKIRKGCKDLTRDFERVLDTFVKVRLEADKLQEKRRAVSPQVKQLEQPNLFESKTVEQSPKTFSVKSKWQFYKSLPNTDEF